MASQTGYMLIADISGYTAYLTSTELDHATPIISSLLESMVHRLGDPLRLWRLEGDAVLAYTTNADFPDGETFLTICEDLYNAFAARRLDIEANTTCECRACAQVPNLDLKVLVHHGRFEEVRIGPMGDISGPDVILVHQMTKTGVRGATGIASYALVSDAAFAAMGGPLGFVEYTEDFEHFGSVLMHAYDLGEAWQHHRDARRRVFISSEDGIFTRRVQLPVPPAAAWQLLMSTTTRRVWLGLKEVTVESDTGRPGPGAIYHCIHEAVSFKSWVLDWQPFDYVSNKYLYTYDPSLAHEETYELTPNDAGCEVRYTTGPLFDPERPGVRFPNEDARLAELYSGFYDPGFPILARLAAGESFD